MKERPILFNTDMVKAILDGRKTQTRRPMKDQPFFAKNWIEYKGNKYGIGLESSQLKNHFRQRFSHWGVVGDHLWVRETWQGPLVNQEDEGAFMVDKESFQNPKYCSYKASGESCEFYDIELGELVYRWKPSIHMPRWACRLVLEITDVRLERIQDITEEDAAAEGTITEEMAAKDGLDWRFGDRRQFQDMWDKVYPNSWENNEWVWVIEFKIVELKTA